MRRWLRREKPDLIVVGMVLAYVVVVLLVSQLLLHGHVPTGAGGVALVGALLAVRERRRAQAPEQPRGRLTVAGTASAALVVWAVVMTALVLVLAIQHAGDRPVLLAGTVVAVGLLVAWVVVHVRGKR